MTAAARKLPALMTTAEFLAWPGDGTDTMYELVEGEPRAMAPASTAHGIIQTNLIVSLANHLRATRPGCQVVTAPGIQPRIRADWNHRIPDLGVSCARNERGQQMLPDPILLVEILSPSNASDTWSNIPLYATLPSVAEILIMHSANVRAELLRRGPDGTWPDNPVAFTAGAVVRLASIDLDLTIDDLYQGTYHLIE